MDTNKPFKIDSSMMAESLTNTGDFSEIEMHTKRIEHINQVKRNGRMALS